MRSARTFLILTILFLTCGPVSANLQASKHTDTANRAEAERLWELAIKAKGGRERLHAVNNLQMSVREKYWWLLKRFTLIEENLYVFPGKSWEWNDQRGSIFGFSIRLHNFERNLHWSYVDMGKGGSLTPILEGGRGSMSGLIDLQLKYLMETRWVRPIPVSVQKGKVGGHDVDIVQTSVSEYPKGPERVAFALDRKTHLPMQVIYYAEVRGEEYSGGLRLSDYVEVNGIQMPRKVGRIKARFQINVEYDERVFEQQPSFTAGIEAWKKR